MSWRLARPRRVLIAEFKKIGKLLVVVPANDSARRSRKNIANKSRWLYDRAGMVSCVRVGSDQLIVYGVRLAGEGIWEICKYGKVAVQCAHD